MLHIKKPLPLFGRLSFIVLILLTVLSKGALAQCGCTFTISAGSGFSYFNGASVHPGDVICLSAGVRDGIQFSNVVGTAASPVIIRNCGGQALIGGPTSNNAMLFLGCHYVHITGTGDVATNYGIKVTASQSGTQGIAYAGLSTQVEIDHVEIANAGYTGMMLKSDPSSNCADQTACRPAFTLTGVSIHDCYVHESGGEGIYLGDSFYIGTTVFCGQMEYCHEVRNVRIFNNRFENTGRESIQVGSGVYDVQIYNNQVFYYGQGGSPTQNGGIQLGIGTAARLYNNFVKGQGTTPTPVPPGIEGPAVAVQGIGGDYVYNNIIVNPGQEGITINTRATPLTTDIVSQTYVGGVYIINNTFISGNMNAVEEFINGAPGNKMYNNLIVAGASAWDKTYTYTDWKKSNNLYIPTIAAANFVNPAIDDYHLTSTSPAVNAGTDVSTYGVTFDYDNSPRPGGASFDLGAFELAGNQKPVVTVGSAISITLPTNTATATGSATDPDGTIAGYQWTQQSGPNTATITTPTSTSAPLSNLIAGVYVFRLTATDNGGATNYADLTVTVIDPAVNQPPVANAGADKVLTLPTNTTVIAGAATDPDGTVASYAWTEVSGPAATLTNAATATLTLTNLVQGVYVFRLTATDNKGAIGTDDVQVTVNAAAVNQPPVANAGVDKTITLPTNSTTIIGSGSDPDGTVASYAWTKQSGPTATLTNATSSTLSLSALVQGSYDFRLTVTDNQGATGFDDMTLTVSAANQPPTANAGPDQIIQLPTTTTTLPGLGSDPDGTVSSYAWIKVSGPSVTLTNANAATLSLSALVQGVYVFSLTVTDNLGATGTDNVQVTVQAANIAPTANAGGGKSITLPINSTTLSGSGTDPDGTIASYAWIKVSGPAATLSNATTATLSLTNLIAGTYVFQLTVTDNLGATGSNQATVTVFPATVNQSPIVNAGPDVTLTLPANSTFLNATASDPDGTIASYAWSQISGPAATVGSTTTSSLSLTNLVAGIYDFRITVTDNQGATASDDVLITVTNVNQNPVVNAGPDQTITLPNSSAILPSTSSDVSGTITGYAWLFTSGPAAVTLANQNTATLTVSGMTLAGTYIFKITVTDSNGLTGSDLVNVIVQSATNVSPVADAGPDIVLFLPTNSVNVTGSGTDSDGTIASYQWTKISGGVSSQANTNTATISITNLVAGSYTYRLTVTDNSGATGIDDVSILVNGTGVNQPPVANAGPDISLTLPVNSTNLIGLGSDADGSIASYSWIEVSGPAANLTNASTAVLSVQNMVQGLYVFQLTVTDNQGATGSATVNVSVLPSTVNQNPIVTAGPDRSINLPTNSATLVAAASDPDGTIASYSWTKQLGPTVTLGPTTGSSLLLSNLIEGSYTFRITVTDNSGASSFAEVTITVLPVGANQPPIVDAGADQILYLPTNSANLVGSASDADGTIASYSWTKVGGPTATLTNATSATLSLSNLVAGQYTFRLTATDNSGASSFSDVTVTLFPSNVNQPPVANAGGNKTIALPNNTAALQGSGSDPDGSIASYSWSQIAGPACTITNLTSPTLLISNLVAGTYQFKLTVTDNQSATGSDIAIVSVSPVGANQPPVANAGLDQVLHLPVNSVILTGSGTDSDGTINAYGWTKKSGPAAGTLTGQSSPNLTLTNLVAGAYIFTLTVTDNGGLTNSDDVNVTVLNSNVNQNPTVNAGPDITIRLPINSVNLVANGTDADGTIAGYLWTQTSGPGTATLAGATTNTLSATALVQGIYIFSVEVTDNDGATGTDDVTVTVAPVGINNPPVVLAGSPKVISLPVNYATLSGSASDSDGSIASLIWTQQAGGPNSAVLTGIGTTTLSVSGMTAGVYTLRLTATDNENATAFSETTITVTPTHNPPIVFAGNDTTLILPNNFLALVGKVTVTDAQIADYVWTQVKGDSVPIVGEYPSISVSDLLPGSYTFRLTATDALGASASDDVTITVQEGAGNPIGAALLFSPNGDGTNEAWTVKNTNMIAGCPCSIFNNLGKKVFEASDYKNDWQGTYNGSPMKEGDYYFVFECGKKVYSGAFRLIR